MRLGPFAVVAGALALLASGPSRAEVVPGHVVVRFRDAPLAMPGAEHLRELWTNVHLYNTPDEASADALVARLAGDPRVAWVEREHVRRRNDAVTPSDPLFAMQWNLKLIKLPDAWNRTEGSPTVVVAVLDTGILPHPDLMGRYEGGFDFVSDPANAGDGDGRDPDPTDPGTIDEQSSALHGTHITGILGAHSDNMLGITGVDWHCTIVPVRVLGVEMGQGTDADIAAGIRWAAGGHVDGVPDNPHPAQVINMSFGGPGLSNLLQDAVDFAHGQGAVVVASAGNDSVDTSNYAPAALNYVIAVAAADGNAHLASYSNRGPRVDILAPGGDELVSPDDKILSTIKDSGWDYLGYQGTSQAAPHVSGVAALVRSLSPTLSADQVRAIVLGSADPTARCAEGCGTGLLDASAALSAAIAAAGCVPACGSDKTCAGGHCVVPGKAGVTVVGGCALGAGGARDALPGAAILAFLVAAAAILRLTRRRSPS